MVHEDVVQRRVAGPHRADGTLDRHAVQPDVELRHGETSTDSGGLLPLRQGWAPPGASLPLE
ncbi:hypothetical protein [Streptomyces sp. NPDC056160]|uniref:hypothetical protein n=1 Tax=Streptomyces sp. NPDC056160 TaxID=3345731 RepID=UPI0035D64C49